MSVNDLFTFIKKHFREYDLERAENEHGEREWSFKDSSDEDVDEDVDEEVKSAYERFLEHQKKCLKTLGYEEKWKLDMLLSLKMMIENNAVCVMDKESMYGVEASGFAFDKNGKLVIFHER